MDVPQIVRIPTKRSKRQSSNGAIQKIPKYEEPKKTSVPPESFYQLFNKNKTGSDDGYNSFKKQFDGWDQWFKQQTLKNQDPWALPPHMTNYDSRKFLEDFTFPPFKAPKVNWDELMPRRSPASTIWISTSSVLFCIFMVLRLCVYWQRCQPADYSAQRRLSLEQQLAAGRHNDPPTNDTESVSLSVTSDGSSHSNPDLPPPYAEIAASNNGVVNKHLDLTSEELPPPYSVCLGVMDNTNEIAMTHKRLSVGQETPSASNTDSSHNNITASSQRTNVGSNNVDVGSLWVTFDNDRRSETVIDIGNVTK